MAPKRSERSGNMSIRHVIILAQNKTKKTNKKKEMKTNKTKKPRSPAQNWRLPP